MNALWHDPKPRRRLCSVAVVLALGILMGLGSRVVWARYEDGVAAYQRGDYATAYREWLPLAAQGHAHAQIAVGVLYANGQGVPQNYAEAYKWFRHAAAQGDARAQYGLGRLYANGQGVPQNYAEAYKWFRHAAAQGDARAQGALGWLYVSGQGVAQDYVQAYMWLNLAVAGTPPGADRKHYAELRENIAKRMTLDQLAQAQQLASQWRPQ